MATPHKSDKVKKFEKELTDLEQWMKLGLVPKKDLTKHKEEIAYIQEKIEHEINRINFLKENGDMEEYITPKRQANRPAYSSEMPSIPDVEFGDGPSESYDSRQNSEAAEESSVVEEKDEETSQEENKEESFFSERSPWRSEGMMDPEADDW